MLKNYLSEIDSETKKLIVELNDNLIGAAEKTVSQLCDYIDINSDILNKSQLAAFTDLKKQESPWQTKLKIGIPLVSLIGLNIESEFKLEGFVKRILRKTKKH